MPNDLPKLQGTWNITSLEVDGQRMPAGAFSGSRVVIKGRKFTSLGMGATYKGTVELDAEKKPKRFDLVFTGGPEKGNRNLGIYKLDGDRWTICLATRGTERPNEYATKPGTGVALETLERTGTRKFDKQNAGRPARSAGAKRGAATQPEPAVDGPRTELEGEWEMISGIFSGEPLDKSMVKFSKRVTRGNLTTVLAGPRVFLEARFTLDRSKDPHAIDYLNLKGASAGTSQRGVFELKGHTLRICMSASGQPRPSDFSSKPGDRRTYTTWRLAKK